MNEDKPSGGCSRRGLMCGASAFSLLGIAGMGQLVACIPGGKSGGTLTAQGDTGGDTGLAACAQSGAVCIDLSDPANDAILGASGSYGYISTAGGILIIIHLADGTYDVLSAICTHQGCTVEYRDNQKDLYCYCHASDFDLSGNVIAGPASRPLQNYSTEIVDSTLVIYT